ncbi:hypothetical protein T439DRAFT_325193 [Meredithblackwellia eburnea MCA 4105]
MPVDSVRSRSGCTTCRRRKKKCDENFTASDHPGICRRCYQGSFECVQAPAKRAGPKPRVKKTAPGSASASDSPLVAVAPLAPHVEGTQPPLPTNAEPPSSSSSGSVADEKPDNIIPAALLLAASSASATASSIPVRSSAVGGLPSSSIPPPPPTPSLAPGPISHISPTQIPHLHAPLHPTTGPHTPLHVITPLDFPEDLELHQELELRNAPVSDQLISFFESLDSMPDPDIHPETSPVIWDSFNLATPGPTASGSSTAAASIPIARGGLVPSTSGPSSGSVVGVVPHCEKPEHADGGCDCTGPSPLYAALNEEFFRSIPNPVREMLKLRTGDVAASHDLTRAASMAMLLLYRARTLNEGSAEAQELLIKQSDHYFQKAVMHLETASIPLEAQMVAVADMQLHQFDQAGAPGVYAILLVGEFFVREALGTTPRLDTSSISDPSTIMLWAFAYADVLRTVCLPRQRSLFDYVGLPGTAGQTPLKDLPNVYFSHIGLPVGLLLCFAAASNLGVDSANLTFEVVRTRAVAIEEAIRSWRPAPPDLTTLLDSSTYVDEVTTQEMWRHAALIYLYQSVYRVGCLSKVIRTALKQILKLGSRQISAADDVSGSVYATSVRGCPWFLAATVAIQSEDRELCRRGLDSCGPQKVHRDNLEAAEKIWELTDTSGWAVDWKDFLEKEGRYVAFL